MILSERDRSDFLEHGWLRITGLVPKELCDSLVSTLQRDLKIPVRNRDHWAEYGGPSRDRVPMWGHQSQWDIRQHPQFYAAWTELWQEKSLLVTLDSCRFTPPWRPGFAEPDPIHLDTDPWNDRAQTLQGVIAITQTSADQGGFCCVPSLYRNPSRRPKTKTKVASGAEYWLPDISGHEVTHVAAGAGDLIVWSSRLPHSNSKNLSTEPRIAFYAATILADRNQHLRPVLTESWRTGECVSWWRNRPGFDKPEKWPPAKLTPLGRRLVGLDEWT